MQIIQRNGLEHMYHVKRPELFSGSWMEDVNAIEDLIDERGALLRASHSFGEALIRVCNLLMPPGGRPPSPRPAGVSEDILARYLISSPDGNRGNFQTDMTPAVECRSTFVDKNLTTAVSSRQGIVYLQFEGTQITEKERDDRIRELVRRIEAADAKLSSAVSTADYTLLKEEVSNLRTSKTQLEIQLMDLRRQASFAAEKARTMRDELDKKCRENTEISVQLAAAQTMIDSMASDAARREITREGYDRLKRELSMTKAEKGTLLRQNEALEGRLERMEVAKKEQTKKEMLRVEEENARLRRQLRELEDRYERFGESQRQERTEEGRDEARPEGDDGHQSSGRKESKAELSSSNQMSLSSVNDAAPLASERSHALPSAAEATFNDGRQIFSEVPAVAALLNLV
ncbi:hypothetical protein FOL46_009261 [Perkinsus olseni]|uniref:Uncharacterized protein n=1 Tax=Perkinsus olseni TaxID=32597 RepID=A0A7J6MM44_PEROL|nr:hypothetical protein FOL46_009261 [Perkinsus olseni]